MERPRMIRIPITALALDGGGVLSYFIGLGLMYCARFDMLSLLFYLGTVILPIVGLSYGIGALCLPRKDIGRSGLIMAISAILLPVLTVIVLVILFSTGVLVITFM